ncbi:MAG: hypothetical protein AB1432_03215 [Bacteroidota bacterium]|jgi:hypothetical protein
MKHHAAFILSLITAFIFLFIVNGCSDQSDINNPFDSSDRTSKALLKITENSPSVNSFTTNYNEEEPMAFSGMAGKELYPVRIGQKLTLVNQDLTLIKDSVTATGTLVQKFDGELIIAGSFKPPTIGIHQPVDTVIHKPFSTTITRIIKYEKVSNSGNDTIDWKIAAISLPSGGTAGNYILIQKLTLTAQDGSVVEINNPNEFFFNVGKDKGEVEDDDDDKYGDDDRSRFGFSSGFGWNGWKKLFTWYKRNQKVTLTLEVLSRSIDPDIITITYGAKMSGGQKSKYKFNLTSSVKEGSYYRKIYERDWKTPSYGGRMHAVINALPRFSAYETDSTVIEKTWGIPFKVK